MSRGQRAWGPPARRRAPRRLPEWLGAFLLILSVSVTAACTGGTAVSRSGATPALGSAPLTDSAAVLERAMQSLSRSGSVRMAMDITDQGHHFRNITYAAADRGRHDITLDGMHASVRVVGDRTFARGDRSSLTGYFGLSDSTAQRLENRW